MPEKKGTGKTAENQAETVGRISRRTKRDTDILKCALAALDGTKAVEPAILDLRKLSSMADYFVIAHGTNERQVQAMAREVERQVQEEFGIKPRHVEGVGAAHWILIDYGDFIVHLFSEEKRGYYQIEKIWIDAPRVEL